ncbi:MAG: DUF4907 domain-containing protein [Bacteroidota bacterium]|nr:DUF4907 domain-containing protein [Bacteroidota bacterium]
MKKRILIFLSFLALVTWSCNNNHSDSAGSTEVAMAKQGMIPIDAVTFKTTNGWGYSILIDHKIFIRQASIPSIEGNNGFSSEEDAAKVAQLVIGKIKKHERPGIKKAELEQMGIIK